MHRVERRNHHWPGAWPAEYQHRYGLKERTLSEHLNEANQCLEVRFDGKRRLYTVKEGSHPSLIWRYEEARGE